MEPKIQFAKRKDGVRIAYTKLGEGHPLIYPAPWVTNVAFFLEDPTARRFWERLAQHFMVIYYDKHGCGMSDRNRTEFTLESELYDLETVIDHFGLDQFILFGISMAGPISIAYTSRHPEKVTHLIIYGAFANGKTITTDDFKTGLISLIKTAWGFSSKVFTDLFIPDANSEAIQLYAKFQRESCTSEIAVKLMELIYALDVTELLAGIRTPTLVLHRQGDKMCPIRFGRELVMEIPDALFKVLKGNIHLPWLGDSNEIIKEILQFVGDREAPTSFGAEHEGPVQGDNMVEIQATIVFTDIVSSTDLVTRLGDIKARELFVKHDKIIRGQLQRHGGKELQNLGDGFMLSFESASAALKCASEIQKQMAATMPSLKIRMGINTGEVVLREGEQPFGQAVVVASRIASKAQGGKIFVSDVTRQLVAGSGLSFIEKGRAKLKGFDESIKLHEVVWKE